MKVFICPNCGWLRVVSRKKQVECFKCGEPQMTETRLPYEKAGLMTEEERRDYAESWLYIHKAKSK